MDAKNGIRFGESNLNTPFAEFAKDYSKRLAAAVDALPLDAVEALAEALMVCWKEKRQVFIFKLNWRSDFFFKVPS